MLLKLDLHTLNNTVQPPLRVSYLDRIISLLKYFSCSLDKPFTHITDRTHLFYVDNGRIHFYFISKDPSCDFEKDLCSWKQETYDDFNWTRISGATPTYGTGPSSGHDGKG